MADHRYKAVVIDEKNIKAPDEPLKIIEKAIPRPGRGEVLVRVFLRPVSAAQCPDTPARAYCDEGLTPRRLSD